MVETYEDMSERELRLMQELKLDLPEIRKMHYSEVTQWTEEVLNPWVKKVERADLPNGRRGEGEEGEITDPWGETVLAKGRKYKGSLIGPVHWKDRDGTSYFAVAYNR